MWKILYCSQDVYKLCISDFKNIYNGQTQCVQSPINITMDVTLDRQFFSIPMKHLKMGLHTQLHTQLHTHARTHAACTHAHTHTHTHTPLHTHITQFNKKTYIVIIVQTNSKTACSNYNISYNEWPQVGPESFSYGVN